MTRLNRKLIPSYIRSNEPWITLVINFENQLEERCPGDARLVRQFEASGWKLNTFLSGQIYKAKRENLYQRIPRLRPRFRKSLRPGGKKWLKKKLLPKRKKR